MPPTVCNRRRGELARLGIELTEARVIRDDEASIIEHVNDARQRASYVFTTGGIGPTHDDITAASVAKAFGVELVRDDEAVRRLTSRAPLNEARLKMAHVPAGAVLIDNPISQAPGFQLENVFVLAGIPSIARAMFESLGHRLEAGAPIVSASVDAHLSEGALAGPLAELDQRFPDVEIGSYPFHEEGRYGARVVLSGTDEALLFDVAARLEAVLDRLRGDYHWEEG